MTKSLFNQGETLLSLSSALSDISALMDRETCAHTRTHTDRPTTITLTRTGEGSAVAESANTCIPHDLVA